jgi:hypothetical protein
LFVSLFFIIGNRKTKEEAFGGAIGLSVSHSYLVLRRYTHAACVSFGTHPAVPTQSAVALGALEAAKVACVIIANGTFDGVLSAYGAVTSAHFVALDAYLVSAVEARDSTPPAGDVSVTIFTAVVAGVGNTTRLASIGAAGAQLCLAHRTLSGVGIVQCRNQGVMTHPAFVEIAFYLFHTVCVSQQRRQYCNHRPRFHFFFLC